MAYCKAVGAEPFICLNMGTGTLPEALNWIEYMNGTDTTYAQLRRDNGHPEPYNVKYIGLGNEIWGDWQVGQVSAKEYAQKAKQWAKVLKNLDPSLKLVACGKEGLGDDWDAVVLDELIPHIDFISIHLYSTGGSHETVAMAPAAAEKAIQITTQLISQARIKHGVKNVPTICFDEWNVWDPVKFPGEDGAEQIYSLTDALAVAGHLNVFIRQCSSVTIACIAQSVNVISPLITSKTGLLKQTTWYPLLLFAKYMHGFALDLHVESAHYHGPTHPVWLQHGDPLPWIDASGTWNEKEGFLTLCVINRHRTEAVDVIVDLFLDGRVLFEKAEVHLIYHDDVEATNTFESPDEVAPIVTREPFVNGGAVVMPPHSIQFVRLAIKPQ